VDLEVGELADRVDHVEIYPALDLAPTPVPELIPEPVPDDPGNREQDREPSDRGDVLRPVAWQKDDKKPPKGRLIDPKGLPGADAPPITDFPEDPEKKKRLLEKLFPLLPPAPQLRLAAPGPEGRPLTLSDLQRLAVTYSPTIKSAEAAVNAAAGAVKQAGAYPNPAFFFEQDTVGTGPAGYNGFGIHQTVKTGNKLKLQQAAAMMDWLNARLALKRAYSDLAYQVRINYFAVLVALEGVKINEALYRFTNEIYRVQVELVEGGFAASYEPMQLRPLAIQARFNLVQAQNQYLASWKQLAATLGLREMPPSELDGQVDMPVPVFQYNDVLARVLARHTDVLTAYNSIQKARFNLELAKVTPVPDVDLNILAQKDTTAPPNLIVHSLQVSIPVPIFDQNIGGIRQAEGLLSQALTGPDQTRNMLTNTLADAYNRYVTARENVDITLQQCRDQLRAYRMLYDRHFKGDPTAPSFGDVVTAQQTLAGYVGGYVTALGLQWTAVNDVANLLQTDDLFGVGPRQEMDPVPDLRQFVPPHGLPPCLPAPPAGKDHRPAPETRSASRSPAPSPSPATPAGENVVGTLLEPPPPPPRPAGGPVVQVDAVAQPAKTPVDTRLPVVTMPRE
jgi:cobalt-zinc-cadmium efflux system outer membrane protein